MNKVLGYNVDDIVSPTFTADAAAKIGATGRTVRHEVQIAANIAEPVKGRGLLKRVGYFVATNTWSRK